MRKQLPHCSGLIKYCSWCALYWTNLLTYSLLLVITCLSYTTKYCVVYDVPTWLLTIMPYNTIYLNNSEKYIFHFSYSAIIPTRYISPSYWPSLFHRMLSIILQHGFYSREIHNTNKTHGTMSCNPRNQLATPWVLLIGRAIT